MSAQDVIAAEFERTVFTRKGALDHAEIAIDALAAAGYAVVKLPEPEADVLTSTTLWADDQVFVHRKGGWKVRVSLEDHRMVPAEARALAAALLAAAAHAEAVLDD